MAGAGAAMAAISGGALEFKATSSPSTITRAIADSLIGGLVIEERIASWCQIPSLDNSHAGIRGRRFLNRRCESACATVFGSDDDTIIERAYWVVWRNIPGRIPHPGGVGEGVYAAANRPAPRDLLAVRQYELNNGSIFIRHALAALSIQHLKANNHLHTAFEDPTLNTCHCWGKTVLVWWIGVGRQSFNIEKEGSNRFIIRCRRREILSRSLWTATDELQAVTSNGMRLVKTTRITLRILVL